MKSTNKKLKNLNIVIACDLLQYNAIVLVTRQVDNALTRDQLL